MGPTQDNKERHTYADYAKWTEDEKCELINGVLCGTALPQLVKHQKILARVFHQLLDYFEDKPCLALSAPTDVILPIANEADDRVDTVIQPDLLIVCDPAKIEEKGIRGAPDLTIEILSDSTAARDLGEKLALYEKHGVRCYIIVDPWSRTCTLREMGPDKKFAHPEIFAVGDAMPIRIFPELMIDLARLFA